MLVLTRKKEEQIVIGEDIVITVVEIANGRVKLGIRAPRHLDVDRREVSERKRSRRPASAGAA